MQSYLVQTVKVVPSAAPEGQSPEFKTAYEKGAQHTRVKDFKKAIEQFTLALRINPKNTIAYSGRAFAHLCLGDYDNAVNDCSRALAVDPTNTLAYHTRGLARSKQKKHQEAMDNFSRILDEINSEDSHALINIGYLCYCLGQFKKAFSCFTKAIAIDPLEPAAFSNRGALLFEEATSEEAKRDFLAALNKDQNFPPANYGMALTLFSETKDKEDSDAEVNLKKKYEEAEEYASKAIQYVTKNAIYLTRACIYLSLKQFDKAIADCDTVKKANPDEALAYYVYRIALQYKLEYSHPTWSSPSTIDKSIIEKSIKEQAELVANTEKALLLDRQEVIKCHRHLKKFFLISPPHEDFYRYAQLCLIGMKFETGINYLIKALEYEPTNDIYIAALSHALLNTREESLAPHPPKILFQLLMESIQILPREESIKVLETILAKKSALSFRLISQVGSFFTSLNYKKLLRTKLTELKSPSENVIYFESPAPATTQTLFSPAAGYQRTVETKIAEEKNSQSTSSHKEPIRAKTPTTE